MSYQWLDMRITEERERRQKEDAAVARLPKSLDEVRQMLAGCVDEYQKAFGAKAAEMTVTPGKLTLAVRDKREGQWFDTAKVEIATDVKLPGFQVNRNGKQIRLEVGMLPGSDRPYYKDLDVDDYVTEEDLTRRILDRVLFPKLPE